MDNLIKDVGGDEFDSPLHDHYWSGIGKPTLIDGHFAFILDVAAEMRNRAFESHPSEEDELKGIEFLETLIREFREDLKENGNDHSTRS